MKQEDLYVCPECGDEVAQGTDGLWECKTCEWFGDRPDHFEGYSDSEIAELRGDVNHWFERSLYGKKSDGVDK